MENNVRRKHRRSVSSKTFVLLLALVLILGIAAGGTLAWLVATSESVTNTFTYGDINIELTEAKPENKQAKIIPGVNIEKDPKVTVNANSEACWLFVEVTEENWPTFTEVAEDGSAANIRKVDYSIADGWTKLDGHTGVYYRTVDATTAATSFDILADNTVTVSGNLTKAEVNSVSTQPKLTFKAYAVQKDGIDSAAIAWAKVPTTSTP